MERVTSSGAPPVWLTTLGGLLPLWRHAVWLVAFVALLVLWVGVRLDVQQLRTDLSRSGRAYREALQENEHLRLELETRHRALAMERAAAELGLVPPTERLQAPEASRSASSGLPDPSLRTAMAGEGTR